MHRSPRLWTGKRYYSSSYRQTIYDNSEDITCEVLNNLLSNQQVSITEEKLTKLKNIPGVKFDLPLTEETYPSFVSLVGKPKTRGIKAGVYIFTHKVTDSKYVGSSNSLSRRLDQYFTFKHFNQENSGLLLPLIKKDGFEAFSLEIFVVPEDLNYSVDRLDYYFLFLEQYHLLNKKFNLNTQRIVNFRVNQGKKIYIYDLEGKTLYYCGKSLNAIKGVLGIHYATCTNCIKNGESYLNFFKITDTPVNGAVKINLSIPEIINLIEKKKQKCKKKLLVLNLVNQLPSGELKTKKKLRNF